jgi:hypothetical protein
VFVWFFWCIDAVGISDGMRLVNDLNKKCLLCEAMYHFTFYVFRRLMFSLFLFML